MNAMSLRKLLFFSLCLVYWPLHAQLTIESDSAQHASPDSPIELSEVIVSARAKNLQSRGLGTFRINSQIVKVTPAFFGERDIVKTLQFLPGISPGMEGSSQLNIRGGTNDQTQYLLDDVPVYNQNHAFGFLSIFNADAISNIALYKGGIPTQYGDKLSGVVAVSLKDGDYQKHHASVSLGLLAGTIASNGYLVKDKLSYNIAARRSFLDYLYNGAISLFSDDDKNYLIGAVFYDVNSKISWKINSRNHLSWQVYSGNDDFFIGNKDRNEDNRTVDKFGFGWKTLMTSFKLTSQFKPNLLYTNTVYYTTLDNFGYYKYEETPFSGGSKKQTNNGTSSLMTEVGAKFLFEHSVSANNRLFYGMDGAYQKYTPDYAYKISDNQKTTYSADYLPLVKYSAYINGEFSRNRWLVTAGVRASLFDNRQSRRFAIEPRVKANYQPNDKNKLMIAYDYTSQPVNTINELNYNVQKDFWIPFQQNKLPQSSQISLGWKNYTTSNLHISVEAYYKKMTNLLLIRNLEYYLDYHTNYETGKGSSTGIEFMAEYTKGPFTAWMSYTLSKSSRTFGNKTMPFKYDAPHSVSAYGNYVVKKSAKKESSLSVNVLYKTGYPYAIPNISYPSPGLPAQSPGSYEVFKNMFSADYIPDAPNTRLRDYFRIDLNYTVERQMKHGSRVWQFSLLNATNRNNPYAVYRHNEEKFKAVVVMPLLPSISYKRNF
jgi:hypothetical protein